MDQSVIYQINQRFKYAGSSCEVIFLVEKRILYQTMQRFSCGGLILGTVIIGITISTAATTYIAIYGDVLYIQHGRASN